MTTGGDPELPVSGRVGLARLAGQVIADTDGVRAISGPAGRWQTVGSAQAIPGVLAAEGAHRCVDLELHLAVRWPPPSLQQLAERLRGQLRRSAETAGMAERLGAVSISFDDVLSETQSR